MTVRMLYLIFIRMAGWMALFVRSAAACGRCGTGQRPVAPVVSAKVVSAPVTLVRSAPVRLVKKRVAPERSAAVRFAPWRSASERSAPMRFTWSRSVPPRIARVMFAPGRLVLERFRPRQPDLMLSPLPARATSGSRHDLGIGWLARALRLARVEDLQRKITWQR